MRYALAILWLSCTLLGHIAKPIMGCTVAVLALGVLPLAAADFAHQPDEALLGYYDQLRKIRPGDAMAVVENVVVKKDVGTFELTNGTLCALEPVGGRVLGVTFAGKGVFRFRPSTDFERRELARDLKGNPELTEPFKDALFLFTDDTLEELSKQVKFRPGRVDSRTAGVLSDGRRLLRETQRGRTEGLLLDALCRGAGVFMATLHGDRHGPLVFSVGAEHGEDVALERSTQFAIPELGYHPPQIYKFQGDDPVEMGDMYRLPSSEKGWYTWCSFRSAASTGAPSAIRVNRTDIEATLGTILTGHVRFEISATARGIRLLPVFRVSYGLVEISASWGERQEWPLKLIRVPEARQAWVVLPDTLREGEAGVLTLAFRVPMGRWFGWANGYQLATWYPRLDEAWNGSGPGRSAIHARFQSPKTDTVVASGKLVRRTEEDNAAFTEWDTEGPYVNTGFRSGQYSVRSDMEGGVQIDLYTPRGGESGAGATGALATVRNAVRLFTAYFGPLPCATLGVSIAPPRPWQPTGSWPMLISLGRDAFVRPETVRAGGGLLPLYLNSGIHEIAHQWWPHLIGYSSYHDEWLAEGGAQLAAALYAHRAEGEKALVQFLKQDREAILSPINGMTEAGPIWLGRRLRLNKNAYGPDFFLKTKGGYVLHMLRMMLYDFKTDDDSRFIRMMKDYSATFKFKNASTEDFKAIVDKHFAQDMGWFFNQWVYGSEVPAVEVEYALNPNEGGVRLEGVLRQSGVSPGFAIELPVLMRFGPAKAVGRIRAFGAETRFHMQLPQRPDTLEFNPLGAVLCRLRVKREMHGNE